MPVTGAHVLLYTPEADALRRFFRDVFEWEHVESHPGWLIFALPPAELGVHPADGSTKQELWLMCDELAASNSANALVAVALAQDRQPRQPRLRAFERQELEQVPLVAGRDPHSRSW